MQFRALGIVKYRIMEDSEGDYLFWKITPYGEYKYQQLMTIRR